MSGFVDLEMDDEAQLDAPMPMGGDRARYPYGLRICLCKDELDKLGLDEDPKHGDYLMLTVMARVTSSTTDDNGRRVELQIEKAKAHDADKADGDD